MRDDDVMPSDESAEDALRVQLHAIVDDIEPAGDSLPKLLATTRRRGRLHRWAGSRPSSGHRVLGGVGAVAVAATAAVVLAVVLPQSAPTGSVPVGVATSNYVTQVRPSVLATVDMDTGKTVKEIAHLSGPVTALAAYHRHVYAAVSGQIIDIRAQKAPRVLASSGQPGRIRAMSASGYGVAYLRGDEAVVLRHGAIRRISVPPRLRAVDVALADDGRLAVLTTSTAPDTRGAGIHIVGPTATAVPAETAVEPVNGCVSLAITWTGAHLAALRPIDCDGRAGFRVATFDPDSGRLIGAGVPVRADGSVLDGVQLSADRLGRFLVSTAANKWLVDSRIVRRLPRSCQPAGSCASVPAVLTGLG